MALRAHVFTLAEATLSNGARLAAAGSGLPQRITIPDVWLTPQFGSSQRTAQATFDDQGFFYYSRASSGTSLPAQTRKFNLADGTEISKNMDALTDCKAIRWESGRNRLLLTNYNEHRVEIRSVADLTLQGTLVAASNGTFPEGLALLPNDKLAISYGAVNRVDVFSRATGALLVTGAAPAPGTNTILIHEGPTDDQVYTGLGDSTGRWRLLNIAAGTNAAFGGTGLGGTFNPGYIRWPEYVTLDPAGHLYVSNSPRDEGAIQVQRYANANPASTPTLYWGGGNRQGQLRAARNVGGRTPIAFSPDGKWVAVCISGANNTQQQWMIQRIGIQRSEWSKLFSTSCVLKNIAVPGCLGNDRDASFDDRKTKCYYSINGVDFTEFTPGATLSLAIAAGTTLRVRADMDVAGKPTGTPPWVGGDAGEGPSLVYDTLVSGAAGGDIVSGGSGGIVISGGPGGGVVRQ